MVWHIQMITEFNWFTTDCPGNARPAQGIIDPRTPVLPAGAPPLTGIIHHGELAPTDRYTALTLTKFRDLMKRMQENRPQDDLNIIKKAYDYSLKHHAGQTRASGEPYLVHPLEVALVLAEMKMDPVAVAAGLLHDSVEDTSVTIVDIRKEFGEQVAHIVEGVTKISKIDFATREEQQAENLRKMMLAMVDDIRVVLIKLADRLHNMRTLEHLPPERQHKIARRNARDLRAHRPPPGHGQDSRRTGRPGIPLP